jgi:hypothetical protein
VEAQMNLRRLLVRMLLLFFVVVPAPMVVLAQNQPSPAASPNAQSLKSEELDALVAPIALYPDDLLTSVLTASTYPLELVISKQSDVARTDTMVGIGPRRRTAFVRCI